MPPKKTPASTDAAKPKKKIVRRKISEKAPDSAVQPAAFVPASETSDLDTPLSYSIPDSSAESNTPASNHLDAREDAQDHNHEDEHALNIISANTLGAAGAMSDIQPKPVTASVPEPVVPKAVDLPKKPVNSSADTSFLRSDNNNFGLKEHLENSTPSWVTKLAYTLGVVIILMVIALVGLTLYTNHAQKNNSTPSQVTDNSGSTSTTDGSNSAVVTPPATSGLKFGIAGPSADYIAKLSSTITAQDNSLNYDSAAPTSLPALSADTLLFKTSAKDKATLLANSIGSYGIKVQLQENNDIADDIVIYLTPIAVKPDLSGNTGTVYNASGKTGAAKTYCDALKKDQLSSCTALNYAGTDKPVGLQVYAKSQAAYFVLKRTTEFMNATFNTASTGQVEDVKVVIGK